MVKLSTVSSLKLMDVTLRDGGYLNNHEFSSKQSYGIVSALLKSDVDLIEIGYLRRTPDYLGKRGVGVCDFSYLESLKPINKNNYVVMVRPGETRLEDYSALKGYGIKVIRVACPPCNYDQQILVDHIVAIRSLGFEVSVNCTRASNRSNKDIIELFQCAVDNKADYFYIADTNGAYYPKDVFRIFSVLRGEKIILGYHAHNNIEMAFINSITAISSGVRIIDASLLGLGKGAGNLDLILMAAYLNNSYGFNIKLEPLFETVEAHLPDFVKMLDLEKYLFKFTGLININSDFPELFKLKKKVLNNGSYNKFLCEILKLSTKTYSKHEIDLYEELSN